MHTCVRCGEDKPAEAYRKDPRYKSGLTSYCRDCYRDYGRLRRYGLTEDQFRRIYESQDGACAICRTGLEYLGKGTHIDHCHAHGHVRGLLCQPCNMALGMLRDDTTRFAAAIDYLNRVY